MQAVRNILRAAPQMSKTFTIPQRNMSVISVPRRNKVGKGEIFALSALMVVGWLTVPAWVLVNIKNYRHNE